MTSNNKYASSKIHKVVDNAYTMCYYGSTTMQLSRRMAKHRLHYRLFGEGKFSRISVFDIFEAHGVHNCKIELVEECPCESKEQLNQREGFHVRSNECVNKNIPGRTLAEWLEDTRDHRLQMALSWQAANPEKVKEADKKYRSNHLQKIKDRASEQVVCNVCGGAHTHHHTARHKLSNKHMVAKRIKVMSWNTRLVCLTSMTTAPKMRSWRKPRENTSNSNSRRKKNPQL